LTTHSIAQWVAVSLSIATQCGSLPIAWQLYVPKEWIDDRERARRAGIPDDQAFATKPQIALAQLREAIASGVVPGIVLADAGDIGVQGSDTSAPNAR
jgi:SRSO17 transposase